MYVRDRIKELYRSKLLDKNNNSNTIDIIKNEINKNRKDLSNKKKNINQREYYKNNKDYYKKKAVKKYEYNKDNINKRRRELYKSRLKKNNISVISFDKNEMLTECKKVATERNGKCLSNEYVNRLTKMKWECDKGHKWLATSNHIVNRGQWCPKCSAVKANEYRKLDWNDIKKLAKNRNGKLISKKEEYINTNSKLEWECAYGHKWKASIGSIKHQKSWCPYCHDNYRETFVRFLFEEFTGEKFEKIRPKWLRNKKTNRLLELDGYNKKLNAAFEYNGRQHYENNEFFHQKDSLKNQKSRDCLKQELCEKNNIKLCIIDKRLSEKEIKNYIRKWLNNNNIFIVKEPLLKDFKVFKYTKQEKFKRFVESIGYELLDSYKGINKKVRIKCDKGHVWNVQPRAVKAGNRCPFCSKKIKYTLEFIKEKADEIGLNCLENEYINNTIRMKFKCNLCGKINRMTSTQIINGIKCECQKRNI